MQSSSNQNHPCGTAAFYYTNGAIPCNIHEIKSILASLVFFSREIKEHFAEYYRNLSKYTREVNYQYFCK